MKLIPRRLLEKLANNLPARDISHPTGSANARPYLRRYYLGTLFNIRFYLHHFVDSDPDGLHNHPWRFGGSLLLSEWYFEERRWCMGANARRINIVNVVNGDTLHRVVVPPHLKAVFGYATENFKMRVHFPHLGVWSLFWHSTKVMPWATLKDKGIFIQYHEESPTFKQEAGHSTWYKTAKKGKELFGDY